MSTKKPVQTGASINFTSLHGEYGKKFNENIHQTPTTNNIVRSHNVPNSLHCLHGVPNSLHPDNSPITPITPDCLPIMSSPSSPALIYTLDGNLFVNTIHRSFQFKAPDHKKGTIYLNELMAESTFCLVFPQTMM